MFHFRPRNFLAFKLPVSLNVLFSLCLLDGETKRFDAAPATPPTEGMSTFTNITVWEYFGVFVSWKLEFHARAYIAKMNLLILVV